jgi:catechol 2,3-dioxygenase-like lactoylglutathione lyase family enzyme
MIKESMYVIAVPSLEDSAKFYRDVLGFKVHEIGDPGWRMYVKDNCHIMAGECPDAIPPRELGDHSYFAYLVVESAEEYFDQIKSNDVEIIKTIKDEPWNMREFAIRTIDGHRIMIGQRLGE